jgi:hypothetical protein
MIDGLIVFGGILGIFGLWAFIENVWQSGLSTTVGSIAEGCWAITKWVFGLAAVGAVLWWLGPLWTIVLFLI